VDRLTAIVIFKESADWFVSLYRRKASVDVGGMKMKPKREIGAELSLEERAELHRELEQIFFGRRRPRRPTLICEDGEVVGEAVVRVSPFDPNWRGET
jgi:hypothetical protein